MKTLVAVPFYNYCEPETEACLRALDKLEDITVVTFGGGQIDGTRNRIGQYMLANGYDNVLFLDSDCTVSEHGLRKMIALDKPVVTGYCPMITGGDIKWAVGIGIQGELYTISDELPSEPLPVESAGAACLLVKRAVFKKLEWPWFEFKVTPTHRIRSEDFEFSARCKKEGIEIWAHPNALIGHYRKVNLLDLMMNKLKLRSKHASTDKN